MNFCSGTSSNSKTWIHFFFQDNTGTSQDKSQWVTSSHWHLTASIFDKRKFPQREDRIQPVKLQAYPKKENHLQVLKPLPSQARLTYTADCNIHTHTHTHIYFIHFPLSSPSYYDLLTLLAQPSNHFSCMFSPQRKPVFQLSFFHQVLFLPYPCRHTPL